MTSNQPLLEIKNLSVSIENKQIVKGLNLTVNPGEIHAIMGPNGSGKSTLCYALAGHPEYNVTGGEVVSGRQERARNGTVKTAPGPDCSWRFSIRSKSRG